MRGAKIGFADEKDGKKNIVGYVGNEKITLKEADEAAKKITRGMKDWSALNERERLQLLHMIAPKKIIEAMAMQNLTLKQKENLISNVWLQKKIADVSVDEKALKKRYKKLVQLAKKKKKNKHTPSFEEVEPMLKAQLAQEKIMKRLMKEIKVKLK
jgi:hypothetical protein